LNGVGEGAVVGGSGVEYAGLNSGIASEAETVFTGLSAAGTTEGVLFGPAGFPAVDDALNGFKAVLTDATPGNGLAAMERTVSDYVGATRAMTLDGSEDYGIGESIAAILPAQVTLKRAVTEDVVVGKSVVIDLGGNTLNGRIDIGAGATYVEIRNGDIADGILVTTATPSVIKLVDVRVHRREGTIYAIRRTNASNVGRCEMKSVETFGVDSFTQGRASYQLEECLFSGIDDGVGNIPVRLWDADGIAIVADNGLVTMESCSNPGSILYSNGAAGNLAFTGFFLMNADMRCFIGGDPANTVPSDDFSLGVCRLGSTFSFAPTLGSINAKLPYNCVDSLLRCDSFTGTATMNFSAGGFFADAANALEVAFVRFTGSAFTGTATFTGSNTIGIFCPEAFTSIVKFEAAGSTGTCNVTNTGALNIQGASQAAIVSWAATQTAAPGPTTNVSAPLNFDDIPFGLFACPVFAGVTGIDVGTTTISSLVTANSLGALHRNLASVFGGQNVVISGIWRCAFAAGRDGFDQILRVARHGGTAGTLTCSAAFFGFGPYFGSFPQLGHATGAGATVVASGARTLAGPFKFDGVFAFLFAQTATSVVSGGGAITMIGCVMQATGIEIADSDVAGASVTVPSAVTLRFCTFEGSFATRTDPDGTYVGSCDVVLDHCTVGPFTPHGTNFPSVFCVECEFSGDPDALLFTATSQADPATLFLFWNCSAPFGRMHTLANTLTLGKPVWVENGLVADAGAATTAEFVGQFDSTARLVVIAAAANNAAGVFFGAAGAAGTRQRAIVHGFGFVVANDATIDQGEALEPSGATLGRVTQATVKRIGYALATTAAGFPTAAGQRVYARLHVDR
jgi:hypothetical protein